MWDSTSVMMMTSMSMWTWRLKSMWKSSTTSTSIAPRPRRTHRGRRAARPPPAWRRRQSMCDRSRPSSLPAQHAGGIVDHRRRNGGRSVGIFGRAAQPRRGGAVPRKRPRRGVGLLDRNLAVGRGDDRGVTWLGQLNTLEGFGADGRGAVLQHDHGAAELRQDFENGAAYGDGRKARCDLVGVLVGMAGDEAERARRHADGDVAIAVLVIEDGAVERDRGVGAKREIGAVDHHQAGGAVGAGAHRLVAQHGVADIDLGAAGAGNADHLVLDHGGLADTRRRLRGRNAGF